MSTRRWVRAAAAFTLSAGALAVAGPVEAKSSQSEHDRIVAFWTNEKVSKAVPRDFVRTARGFEPAAGKPGGGGTTSTVAAASWTGGGAVLKTTGKVLFSMDGAYYVCSASVVKDNTNDRSIILTAGHCAYDETSGAFAENWMFVPDYDSAAVALDTAGNFCANTTLGCWTAMALVVADGFASAGGFNDDAIVHDYAFAVVGEGGKPGGNQLDTVVGGGQAIDCTAVASGADVYLFGYPAAQKFTGRDLVYSRGPLGFDGRVSGATYGVASTQTGGSSGGPWFKGFNPSTGVGTLMSVNSYGYSGVKVMYGPILNVETQSMLQVAKTATGDVIYP